MKTEPEDLPSPSQREASNTQEAGTAPNSSEKVPSVVPEAHAAGIAALSTKHDPEIAPKTLTKGNTEEPAASDATQEPHNPGPNGHAEPQRESDDDAVRAASGRKSRRAFLVYGAGAAAGYSFYHWLESGPRRDMVSAFLDQTYGLNADVSKTVFNDRALAPTYPMSRAKDLRVNGIYGLKKTLSPESYRLQVVGIANASRSPHFVHDVTAWKYEYLGDMTPESAGHDTKVDPSLLSSAKMAPDGMQDKMQEAEGKFGRLPRGMEEAGESRSTLHAGTSGLLLRLEDFLPMLPRHEFATQFKCIEGWSQIVHWAGVRMADFIEAFPPAATNGKEPKYVYMETPDGDYYVGYDLHICRHPQSLLVTEMMGAPLTQYHGAPLRMHMPTKYGYKQIKRIGLIAYTNEKPDDYWTKLGYDWYGGL